LGDNSSLPVFLTIERAVIVGESQHLERLLPVLFGKLIGRTVLISFESVVQIKRTAPGQPDFEQECTLSQVHGHSLLFG
jgi:hypothetical protein